MTSERAPTVDAWPAPTATGPVTGAVRLPGSKSMTNRALVLAALAPGSSLVRGALDSRDTRLMADGLRVLGAGVATAGSAWTVTGPAPSATGGLVVDVGNAGTVARFLPAVAALGSARVRFDGDPRVRERPVAPLLAALRSLGATVEDGGRGALPVTVAGTGGVRGGEVRLDASASSQLVSGLLLAAPRFDLGVRIELTGAPPSTPHLAMTVAMLRACGATVPEAGPLVYAVSPGGLRAADVRIEPDLSTAAPYLAAAAVTGGRVLVPGWPTATTQPGAAVADLLARMGCAVTLDGEGLTVCGPERPGQLTGLDVDLGDVGELTPVLAAVCTLAGGPSRLRGVAHLRRHETDRLAALATELSALGGDVRETSDGLEIRPRPMLGGLFTTYDDHRLVMAAAVVGLVVPGVVVHGADTVAKTDPGFRDRWSRLLGPGA